MDLYTERLIQEAMDELLAGRTVLMIAHRFATVKKAGRIAVMDKGKIDAVGSHQELIAENEIYKKLTEKQLM